MKIIEWNIKGAASLGWNNEYEIKKDIVAKIIEQKADIIVLTEFVAAKRLDNLFDCLKTNGYIWFLKCETGENGILISVKEEMVDKKKLKNDIYNKKAVSSIDNGCNILRVDLPLKCGSMLTVIGCRMKTNISKQSLQEQYDSERKCFDEILIPMIDKSEGLYIICGDFNNARCLGKLNKKYKKEDYIGKAQCNYNLNIIKDKFEYLRFVMVDVGENGEAIPTHSGYIPDDHIFVRGFNKNTCSVIPVGGLSDHDIIMATVEICEESI